MAGFWLWRAACCQWHWVSLILKVYTIAIGNYTFSSFAYPAYCSIQALESKTKGDDTQWLTYWVVFAAFSVIEYFADFIAGWVVSTKCISRKINLLFFEIPFYWLSKCLFMVWCMAPIENNGSSVIYSR